MQSCGKRWSGSNRPRCTGSLRTSSSLGLPSTALSVRCYLPRKTAQWGVSHPLGIFFIIPHAIPIAWVYRAQLCPCRVISALSAQGEGAGLKGHFGRLLEGGTGTHTSELDCCTAMLELHALQRLAKRLVVVSNLRLHNARVWVWVCEDVLLHAGRPYKERRSGARVSVCVCRRVWIWMCMSGIQVENDACKGGRYAQLRSKRRWAERDRGGSNRKRRRKQTVCQRYITS